MIESRLNLQDTPKIYRRKTVDMRGEREIWTYNVFLVACWQEDSVRVADVVLR
jgi:hypothetical protein